MDGKTNQNDLKMHGQRSGFGEIQDARRGTPTYRVSPIEAGRGASGKGNLVKSGIWPRKDKNGTTHQGGGAFAGMAVISRMSYGESKKSYSRPRGVAQKYLFIIYPAPPSRSGGRERGLAFQRGKGSEVQKWEKAYKAQEIRKENEKQGAEGL